MQKVEHEKIGKQNIST